MEKYELSRVTVRQAMTNLVQSGYARARRGIGTDVVYEKVEEQMEGVISFTEEMKKHHIEMQTTYCKMELISPGETVARSLQIPLTEPCYCLKRVRNALLRYSVGVIPKYFFTYCAKNDTLGNSKSTEISLILLLECLSSGMICSMAFS